MTFQLWHMALAVLFGGGIGLFAAALCFIGKHKPEPVEIPAQERRHLTLVQQRNR